MTADRQDSIAGSVLLLISVFLLAAAPAAVLAGSDPLGSISVAIAGVGFAVLHLCVVIAVHGRALAAASMADADELRAALGGGRPEGWVRLGPRRGAGL